MGQQVTKPGTVPYQFRYGVAPILWSTTMKKMREMGEITEKIEKLKEGRLKKIYAKIERLKGKPLPQKTLQKQEKFEKQLDGLREDLASLERGLAIVKDLDLSAANSAQKDCGAEPAIECEEGYDSDDFDNELMAYTTARDKYSGYRLDKDGVPVKKWMFELMNRCSNLSMRIDGNSALVGELAGTLMRQHPPGSIPNFLSVGGQLKLADHKKLLAGQWRGWPSIHPRVDGKCPTCHKSYELQAGHPCPGCKTLLPANSALPGNPRGQHRHNVYFTCSAPVAATTVPGPPASEPMPKSGGARLKGTKSRSSFDALARETQLADKKSKL